MPPPPPPSKSYLWKFDSSSEEEEEEDDRDYVHNRSPTSSVISPEVYSENKYQAHKPVPVRAEASQNPNAHMFEMLRSLGGVTSTGIGTDTSINSTEAIDTSKLEEENEGESTCSVAKKKKKKKRKKKKKKKTKCDISAETVATSANTSADISAKPKPKKRVSFSEIHVAEFVRDMNGDGVPSDGGWPLGLSDNLERKFIINIDEFEEKKKIGLRDRYEKYVVERRKKKTRTRSGSFSRRKRSNSKCTEDLKKESSSTSKSESHNLEQLPVYIPENYSFESRQFDYKGRSSDKQREDGTDGKLEWEEIYSTGRNTIFTMLGESERKRLFARDVNVKSTTSLSSQSSSLDEMFCSQEVKHIRNELEQIRIHRTAENSAGCSCRKLHVVLPTDLHGGKKSHHHRRMTERRVKDELRRRHVAYESNLKREELEQLLHDTVEEQGCCYGNDCPCSRSGIGCQSDTCSCWFTSHVSHNKKDHKQNDSISPAEAKVRCGNRNGIYVVDFDAIAKYRDSVCKPPRVANAS